MNIHLVFNYIFIYISLYDKHVHYTISSSFIERAMNKLKDNNIFVFVFNLSPYSVLDA